MRLAITSALRLQTAPIYTHPSSLIKVMIFFCETSESSQATFVKNSSSRLDLNNLQITFRLHGLSFLSGALEEAVLTTAYQR